MPIIMLRDGNIPVLQYKTEIGFQVEKFRQGQESNWAEIEYIAGEFSSKEEALKHFYREFDHNITLFKERCFFVYNCRNEIIGTATSWEDRSF